MAPESSGPPCEMPESLGHQSTESVTEATVTFGGSNAETEKFTASKTADCSRKPSVRMNGPNPVELQTPRAFVPPSVTDGRTPQVDS